MSCLWAWRPWRRFLSKLSDYLPERWQERIMDYLYPDDAIIVFKEAVADE